MLKLRKVVLGDAVEVLNFIVQEELQRGNCSTGH